MTLPVSGAISFNNINVELGVAGTTQASLGQSSYRTLAGVPSGAISMSNFYGKSNRTAVSYTFSSNTANASLNLSSLGGYTAGTTDFTVTINSGIYLYATSTGNYGLNITGGTTGDTLTIVNNGYIMGQGGTGGYSSGSGSAGGPALNLGFGMSSCTINNTNGSAYIGGGGGGGGGGYPGTSPYTPGHSGGGGGGAGGGAGAGGTNGTTGGAGGGIGSAGGNGASTGNYTAAGGGGRIFPGTGGAGGSGASNTVAYGGGAGGGGGSSYATSGKTRYYNNGAAGGAGNAAGTTKSSYSPGAGGGGGGGGWGASGGSVQGYTSGGAGGKAVNLNGKSLTWTSGDTARVYGAVS